MSIEALWSIEFGTNVGTAGTGVIVLETNRILGRGANYYVGNYSTKDNKLNGEVEVTHFGGPMNSVFGGLKQFQLVLTGSFTSNQIVLNGGMKNETNRTIGIVGPRHAELP